MGEAFIACNALAGVQLTYLVAHLERRLPSFHLPAAAWLQRGETSCSVLGLLESLVLEVVASRSQNCFYAAGQLGMVKTVPVPRDLLALFGLLCSAVLGGM